MTEEQKLDAILKHLATENNKGEFWEMYDDRAANDKDYNGKTWLFKHLSEIGIKKEEMMPMVYYLIDEGYIDANWQEHEVPKSSGLPPNQIKIRYTGKKLYKNKGFVRKKRNECLNKIWKICQIIIAIITFSILLSHNLDIKQLKEILIVSPK